MTIIKTLIRLPHRIFAMVNLVGSAIHLLYHIICIWGNQSFKKSASIRSLQGKCSGVALESVRERGMVESYS